MVGPAGDAAPRSYTKQVRDALESAGASLDVAHVSDTVSLLGGSSTGDGGTSETAVIVVAAGPDETLEKKHLRLLRKAVRKYEADSAKAHARGGARDEITQLCDTHDIRFLSWSEIFERTTTTVDSPQRPPADPEAGQSAPPERSADQQPPPAGQPPAQTPSPDRGADQSSRPQREGQPRSEAKEQAPTRPSWASLPVVGGLVRGGISYLVSLVLVVGMYFLEASRDSSGGPNGGYGSLSYLSESDRTGWEVFTDALGWVHFNAHTVPLKVTTPEETATVDMLDLMPVESALAYHVAPAIVLLIFGYGLAHATAARDARSGFTAGICLVVGYGLFAAIGAVLFRFSANGVVYRPLLPRAIAIAGLAYPIAGGGLGGAARGLQSRAVAALRNRDDEHDS